MADTTTFQLEEANPLLADTFFPDFQALRPEHVAPAIGQLLEDNRTAVTALLDGLEEPTWATLVAPLEALDDRLERAWAPVSHLHSVVNTPAWREVYEAVQPSLTAWQTELGQNRRLFEAYQALASAAAYQRLDAAQRKVIDNALRDFRLSGVALEGTARSRYGELRQQLAELAIRFANNVLDATQGWFKHVPDAAALRGVPDSVLPIYREAAQARDLAGYVVTLDGPAYLPLLQYADDRDLRRELYVAYTTRASDEGPMAGCWDNSDTMQQILALRQELAELLGFANYAEFSLATKMADTPHQVAAFLDNLARQSRPHAERDFEELTAFGREQLGLGVLEAWDIPYASEKLRQARYALSQEALRPYFPAERVVDGLFAVVERLFGVRFTPVTGIPVWHDDVRVFALERTDVVSAGSAGEPIAWCYLDLYARTGKRGGAWMDVCRSRRRLADGSLQQPVAFLTCNFTPPTADCPALLTHDEVTTLFHEFGHGLHHMLTRVEPMAVSGINGVAWDAVELPSQFLENWCWEPAAIPLLSGHYRSGELLPRDLLDKLLAARNFQSGLFMLRQIEFALFDLRLHHDGSRDPTSGRRIQTILDGVRNQVAVVKPPPFNRFQHGFTHIFGGGYAAGYYSYKWAEVLSADAFAAFEEEGIFNDATGRRFLGTILEQGGAREPMALFIAFRGREPTTDALLRHCGMASADSAMNRL